VGKPLIVVGSVTFAMKGRNLLEKRGIQCSVERIPRSAENHGCGYGIYVPGDPDAAERVLRLAGIPLLGREERGVGR
jgi:hypothetical protein